MWSAMDAEKFKQFEDVAALLRYLQMCVHSVIIDHVRSNQTQTVTLEAFAHLPAQDLSSIEEHVTAQLERHRLWQTVSASTRNELETFVLQLSFLHDLKPSEIFAALPDQFESVNEVYQIKRNLLNRLRRNPAVRQFLSK
jgi:DNA-directed RNA polymerase specialized sigma24 family protein